MNKEKEFDLSEKMMDFTYECKQDVFQLCDVKEFINLIILKDISEWAKALGFKGANSKKKITGYDINMLCDKIKKRAGEKLR